MSLFNDTAKEHFLRGFKDTNMYILLGSGTTVADPDSDTTLETEELRIPARKSRYSNTICISSIYPYQMPSDSYTEFGLVKDGYITKDTGTLLDRRLQSFSKSSSTEYLIQYKFVLSGFNL